ncbi:MAG: SDR family oxidoreductase [Candidatus Woesearchaeota archaeon]
MKIIITGGSRGLGAELAKNLKGEIHVLDIIKGDNNKVHYHVIDITKDLNKVLTNIGEVDLVINNAGIMKRGSILDNSLNDFEDIVKTNVIGAWNVTRHTLLKKDATILFINSRHGLKLKKEPAFYSLTKKWLDDLAILFSHKYRVKNAYLGPFEGGVSKTDLTKEEYEKRALLTTKEICDMILDLLKRKKNNLIFDEENNSYKYK